MNQTNFPSCRHLTVVMAALALTLGATAANAQIPSPWAYADVGNVGMAGSATYSSDHNVLTITAAGSDIWGTSDSFGYMYQPLVGDGWALVNVRALTNTDTFAKAGIMIRQSLDPSSPEVILDVRPTGDAEFMTRPAAGAVTTYLGGSRIGFAGFVELFRDGSTVTAYADNGTTRTTIGSTTIAMGQNLLIGIAVTSHDPGALTTATLSLPVPQNYPAQPFPIRFMNNTDIGAVGLAGSATYANGTFTVRGAGADIWGTADAFHFIGVSSVPTDSIVARVTSVGNTDPFAKAGIDMRLGRGPSPSDSHVILDVRPTGDVEFMVRPKAGQPTTYVAGMVEQVPVWLKLSSSATTISGYVSTDGVEWTLIGTADPDFAGMNAGDGWISAGLVVTSHNPSVLNTSTFDNVGFIRNFNNLPEPWLNGDVGDTGAAGATSWAGGVFTLQGSGADIWGTADAFQFMYQRFNGCCLPEEEYPLAHLDVSARVTSIADTDTFAKAGVMLRTSSNSYQNPFDPNAADVILDVRPGGEVEFMARPGQGAATSYIGGTSVTLPVWLKLTRIDNTVTGYVSADGANWSAVGSTTTGVSFDDEEIGVVVTSHVRGTLNTATFDHVLVRVPEP